MTDWTPNPNWKPKEPEDFDIREVRPEDDNLAIGGKYYALMVVAAEDEEKLRRFLKSQQRNDGNIYQDVICTIDLGDDHFLRWWIENS